MLHSKAPVISKIMLKKIFPNSPSGKHQIKKCLKLQMLLTTFIKLMITIKQLQRYKMSLINQ